MVHEIEQGRIWRKEVNFFFKLDLLFTLLSISYQKRCLPAKLALLPPHQSMSFSIPLNASAEDVYVL